MDESRSCQVKERQRKRHIFLIPFCFGFNFNHRRKKYSEKSDVWSFGVTCYEIWARKLPYSDLPDRPDPVQIATLVASDGLHPIFPKETPKPVVEVLNKCFTQSADERPTFTEMYEMLAKL